MLELTIYQIKKNINILIYIYIYLQRHDPMGLINSFIALQYHVNITLVLSALQISCGIIRQLKTTSQFGDTTA